VFTELCCVSGFGAGLGGQFYVNTNGPLPIVPANGFFLGVVVEISQLPTSTQPIVFNRGAKNEGWELTVEDGSVAPDSTLRFTFTVYGGAGPVATVSALPSFANVDPLGILPSLTIPIFCAFEPPSGGAPDGQILIRAGGSGPDIATLSAPYVNSAPALNVGRDDPEAFLPPNCLVGIVGGEAPWADGQLASQTSIVFDAWVEAIIAVQQFVEVPDPSPIGLVNQNGWRVEGAIGEVSPDPWPDFVDAEPLVYGTPPPAGTLLIDCYSPVVFAPDNTAFPYGP
jgi:hypothetical protein